MVIQSVIKKLIIIIAGLLCFNMAYTQDNQYHQTPLKISSDVRKNSYYPGDTIRFTVKNLTKDKRFYSVESTIMNNDIQTTQHISGEILNAYFNRDTSFFENLKLSYNLSKKNNLGYVMPDLHPIAYSIDADSSVRYIFIVKGKMSRKGIEMKLRIDPGVIAGDGQNVIETKSFWLFIDLHVAGYKSFL